MEALAYKDIDEQRLRSGRNIDWLEEKVKKEEFTICEKKVSPRICSQPGMQVGELECLSARRARRETAKD